MGLDDCRRVCDLRGGTALPIYADENTMDALRRVFQYAFANQPIPKGYFIPEPHVIQGPFVLGDLEIVPITLPHGRMGSTGYLFVQNGKKRLAYEMHDVREGIYVVMRFRSEAEAAKELERQLGLNEDVLRALLIRLDKQALEAEKVAAAAPPVPPPVTVPLSE